MVDPSDHLDQLAALFLTDQNDDNNGNDHGAFDLIAELEIDREAATNPCSTIEVVVVGHLPVRANLWLTQYADDVARQEGATALIRLDTGQWIMEIVRGDKTAARATGAESLQDAIRACSANIDRWIIRPESKTSFADTLTAQPDVITVLSGADEAAVVAAYRIIKDFVDAAESKQLALPPIELAILGADQEQAERAAANLAATARNHLEVEVPLRRTVRSMGSLGSTLHIRFHSDVAPSLDNIISAIDHPETDAIRQDHTLMHFDEHTDDLDNELEDTTDYSDEHDDHHQPSLPAYELELDEPKVRSSQPVERDTMQTLVTPIGRDESILPDPTRVANGGAIEEPTPGRLRPKPSVQVEAKHVMPTKKPTQQSVPRGKALSQWIAGLAVLPVRCPDAEAVEVAVDAKGHLHLIAWHYELRSVSLAETWVQKNRQLITLACPNYTIAEQGPIEAHIVTSEPSNVADLHGTNVRLHVLAAVEVEGRTGWYAAPLSA